MLSHLASLILTGWVGQSLQSRADAERYARQHLLPLALAAARPAGADVTQLYDAVLRSRE